MQDRDIFLESLTRTVHEMLEQIEEKEVEYPDLVVVRAMMEELCDEIESIQEEE